MKAILVLLAGDIARTQVANDLLVELDAAGASVPTAVAEAARTLDKYYAPTRYPDALGGASPLTAFTASDGTSASVTAWIVLDWARSRLDAQITPPSGNG